jgi:hypothetical protein
MANILSEAIAARGNAPAGCIFPLDITLARLTDFEAIFF